MRLRTAVTADMVRPAKNILPIGRSLAGLALAAHVERLAEVGVRGDRCPLRRECIRLELGYLVAFHVDRPSVAVAEILEQRLILLGA